MVSFLKCWDQICNQCHWQNSPEICTKGLSSIWFDFCIPRLFPAKINFVTLSQSKTASSANWVTCQRAKILSFSPWSCVGPRPSELSSKDLPRLSINASSYHHPVPHPPAFNQTLHLPKQLARLCLWKVLKAVPGLTCFTWCPGQRVQVQGQSCHPSSEVVGKKKASNEIPWLSQAFLSPWQVPWEVGSVVQAPKTTVLGVWMQLVF